jgi:hypothetical protein
VNPGLASPSEPSLVTALLLDRMREAEESRRAAAARPAGAKATYRFRRFLVGGGIRSKPAPRPTPVPHGR